MVNKILSGYVPTGPGIKAALSLLRSGKAHAKHLTLHLPYYDALHEYDKEVAAVLALPAPSLEILQILAYIRVVHRWDQGLQRHDSAQMLEIFHNLLAGRAPCLRELLLWGSFPQNALWAQPILHNLTSLTLCCPVMEYEEREPVALNDVLSSLKIMTNLDILILDMSHNMKIERPYFLQSSEHIVSDIVPLPSLSTLRLVGDLEDIATLASHIRAPVLTRAELIIDIPLEDLDTDLKFRMHETERLLESLSVKVASLAVEQTRAGPYLVAVMGWTTDIANSFIVSEKFRDAEPEADLKIKLLLWDLTNYDRLPYEYRDPPAPREGLARIAHSVSSLQSIACARELRVVISNPWCSRVVVPLSLNGWILILRELSAIKRLVLRSDPEPVGYADSSEMTFSILKALKSDQDLLPSLTTLCLYGWRFSAEKEPRLTSQTAKSVCRMLQQIIDDRNIQYLQLESCLIRDNLLNQYGLPTMAPNFSQ